MRKRVQGMGAMAPRGVQLQTTEGIRRSDDYVAQCAWCGLLVCASHKPLGGRAPDALVKLNKSGLGACPACGGQQWWQQELCVGPFHCPAAHLLDTDD